MWFVGKSELLSLIQCHCLDEVMPAFSDHRSLRKNAVIYRPDESSEHVYLLKSGSVRLYRLTEDGQEITLAFVKAGMIFGDGDVLNEESYSHHAQALTPSMVCYIRKADFKELLARYDVINQFVLRNHYLRWQEAQQLIENLSLHDVRKRLVNILVMFSGQVGTPLEHPEHGDTILIDLPIAQDKLAEFIGTSRESVNRHFSDLKAEGFVDMHERKIVLTPAFITRYITKAPAFAALPANPAPHVFRVPLMRA